MTLLTEVPALFIDTPLRVTWRTTASRGEDATFVLVGERLIAAQVLEVSVRLRQETLVRHTGLLGRIATQARLEVVLDADDPGEQWASCRDSLELLAAKAPGRVGVAWDCTSGVERRQDLTSLPSVPPGVETGIAACPGAANSRAVLDLARTAAGHGVKLVKLTHPDLTVGDPADPIFAHDVRRLLADDPGLLGLPSELKRAGCQLAVHDLFLSRAFLGAWPAAYQGCQAGATMAHVDGRGNVYPCSALPVVLGNLSRLGLDEIWAQRERATLRSLIETPGPLCASCGDYPVCRGGCRGLAYVVNKSWEGPDPACPSHAGVDTYSPKRGD